MAAKNKDLHASVHKALSEVESAHEWVADSPHQLWVSPDGQNFQSVARYIEPLAECPVTAPSTFGSGENTRVDAGLMRYGYDQTTGEFLKYRMRPDAPVIDAFEERYGKHAGELVVTDVERIQPDDLAATLTVDLGRAGMEEEQIDKVVSSFEKHAEGFGRCDYMKLQEQSPRYDETYERSLRDQQINAAVAIAKARAGELTPPDLADFEQVHQEVLTEGRAL